MQPCACCDEATSNIVHPVCFPGKGREILSALSRAVALMIEEHNFPFIFPFKLALHATR